MTTIVSTEYLTAYRVELDKKIPSQQSKSRHAEDPVMDKKIGGNASLVMFTLHLFQHESHILRFIVCCFIQAHTCILQTIPGILEFDPLLGDLDELQGCLAQYMVVLNQLMPESYFNRLCEYTPEKVPNPKSRLKIYWATYRHFRNERIKFWRSLWTNPKPMQTMQYGLRSKLFFINPKNIIFQDEFDELKDGPIFGFNGVQENGFVSIQLCLHLTSFLTILLAILKFRTISTLAGYDGPFSEMIEKWKTLFTAAHVSYGTLVRSLPKLTTAFIKIVRAWEDNQVTILTKGTTDYNDLNENLNDFLSETFYVHLYVIKAWCSANDDHPECAQISENMLVCISGLRKIPQYFLTHEFNAIVGSFRNEQDYCPVDFLFDGKGDPVENMVWDRVSAIS